MGRAHRAPQSHPHHLGAGGFGLGGLPVREGQGLDATQDEMDISHVDLMERIATVRYAMSCRFASLIAQPGVESECIVTQSLFYLMGVRSDDLAIRDLTQDWPTLLCVPSRALNSIKQSDASFTPATP